MRWLVWIMLLVTACAVGGPARSPRAGTTARAARAGRHGLARSRSRSRSLAHLTVGIDPGHNGDNYAYPQRMDRKVWNGREYEDCNTTGTETDSGYTESRFTFRVARDLRRDLRRDGARVIMTRHTDSGVGPCVNTRARIINHSHATVGIDIHADGGPASGRGFAILEPVRDKDNRHVVAPSKTFAHLLRRAMLRGTPLPTSTYDGHNGLNDRRADLAGLNLTKVPLVLIECGNMRNATDARLLSSTHYQHRIAAAMAKAITQFARNRHHAT